VQRELCNLVNLIPTFKQPTRRFVAAVVKMKVLDSEYLAGSGESCTHASSFMGKDARIRSWLTLNDRPSLRCHFEFPMISFLAARVLGIPNHTRSTHYIQILP
jgi:hypothetical protein